MDDCSIGLWGGHSKLSKQNVSIVERSWWWWFSFRGLIPDKARDLCNTEITPDSVFWSSRWGSSDGLARWAYFLMSDMYILNRLWVDDSFTTHPSFLLSPNTWSVRIVDPPTRLLLIRVSREWCNRVRASLTLLTTLSTRPEGGAALLSRRVIASAVSVNGSTRTAKLAMIAQARQFYRNERMKVSRSSYPSDVPTNRISRSLERLLATIQSIDW